MHMVISQEPSLENWQEKCRAHTLTHIWRERALSKCTWTSHENIFMQESAGKKPGPRSWPHTFYKPAQSTCNGHLTRATLCDNFQEKCRVSKPGKTRGADRADFVRACAIKMDMDISQEQFYARISKNATTQMEHPSNPGLYSYRKNPSVWTHVDTLFGEKYVLTRPYVFSRKPDPGAKGLCCTNSRDKRNQQLPFENTPQNTSETLQGSWLSGSTSAPLRCPERSHPSTIEKARFSPSPGSSWRPYRGKIWIWIAKKIGWLKNKDFIHKTTHCPPTLSIFSGRFGVLRGHLQPTKAGCIAGWGPCRRSARRQHGLAGRGEHHYLHQHHKEEANPNRQHGRSLRIWAEKSEFWSLEIFGWWRILGSWRLEVFEGLKTLGGSMGGDCAQSILGWNRWCTKHRIVLATRSGIRS